MAGIPSKYKRQVRKSVKTSRAIGESPPAPKLKWSFIEGDLVKNKDDEWGIVVRNPDDHGWMLVMTAIGEEDWHGSRTERIQKQ